MEPSCKSSVLLKAWQQGTDYWPYPLPPSAQKHTQHPGDNSMLTPKKETTNIQIPMPKINSNPPPQNGLLLHEEALQDYSLSSLNSQKKKHKQDEEGQKPFPVKGTGEFT